MTAQGPKVPESPEEADTAEIDEGWGEVTGATAQAPAVSTKPPAATTKPPAATTKPPAATTKPPMIATPLRAPLVSSPEIILGEELSSDILGDLDPDPIEYDADVLLSDSRPTLPVPNPLKYDIVPESERNTAIPPEPRVPGVPKIPRRRK